MGKKPQNYKNTHAETSVFEQKSIKIDDFNEFKEREVKERIKKRIMKGREVAEKDKLLKKKKNKRKIRKMRKKCGGD